MEYDLRDSEIRRRVSQTLHLGIKPERLYEYAYLHECALRTVQRDGAAQSASIGALYRSYGLLYSFENGENDPKAVEQLYRDSRQQAQRIHATAVSLIARLTEFENLCLKGVPVLPLNFFKGIRLVSTLRGASDILSLVRLRAASLASLSESGYPGQTADKLAALREDKKYEADHLSRNLARETAAVPTHSALALVWWHTGIPKYRGKWKDMYGLANEWKLSTTIDEQNFQKYVKRLLGRTSFPPTPQVGVLNPSPSNKDRSIE